MTVQNGTGARGSEPTRSLASDRSNGAEYQELLSIGRGGSANISIALARGIGGFSKLVVLKSIRDELSADSSAAEMFMDEARLSARMNHPNVVQVYEVFLRRGVPVIVMEYLDGQALSAILAQANDPTTLSLDVVISILTKVLAGLHYAHTLRDFAGEAVGLIHRDVSPHNVMVTYDGQVKLVDFGIAKLANSEDQTRNGVVKGKLAYMAPEQFVGKVDCRADVFGVGVMLWEVAARQRFWGDLPEPALIGRLISGDLPHLFARTDMSPEIAQICERALAHNVDDRYPSAAAMQEDLERYLARNGALVTQAAIGQLVTETCANARKLVQRAIREQLSELGLSLTDADDVTVRERVRRHLHAGKWRRRSIWLATAGLGALGVGGVVWRSTQAMPPLALAAAASVDAPTVHHHEVGPTASVVQISASAQPDEATWYLDGRKVDSNPVSMSFPKDDTLHTLRAEAEGYRSFSKSIRFGADADITVTLVRQTPESGTQRPAAQNWRAERTPPNRHSAAALPAKALPVEPAPPLGPAAATKSRDTEPVPLQFGEPLERPARSERERRGIDAKYPGGG